MTKVNRVRDSMKARPSTSRSWMPARAPGLRARASVAEAVALPWPSPQRPAAMAMPIPAPMGTRLAPPAAFGSLGKCRHCEEERRQGHE